MLIPLNNFKKVYENIINQALEAEKEGTTIYIFISNDSDSLCALKMIKTLLKHNEALHTCIPIFSNTHLLEELEKLESIKCIRSFIFINCGGLLDLTQCKFYKNKSNLITSYIFDSHRPFHHANINDELKKICIIHDGCKSFDECPTLEEVKFLEEHVDSGDDDEYGSDFDSEDEEEVKEELRDLKGSDDEEEVYGEKVEKKKFEDLEDEEGEGMEDEEDLDEVKVG